MKSVPKFLRTALNLNLNKDSIKHCPFLPCLRKDKPNDYNNQVSGYNRT